MKQRLIAYLLACLLMGVLFATISALCADGDWSPVRIRAYPTADIDQAIKKINELHLDGISAYKWELKKNFAWFCLQTLGATLGIVISTALVLVTYTAICRSFKISLKK